MLDFRWCIPIAPLDFGFFPPMEKTHRGEDLEAKGPQLAKNLRLRHSEIFFGGVETVELGWLLKIWCV